MAGLAVYGEMVGALWSDGSFQAAVALEELWKDLLSNAEFELFCGYPIDVLGAGFQIGSMRSLLSTHTHVVPALSHGFDFVMQRPIEEVLGDRGHGLRPLAAGNFGALEAPLPPAERTILSLRSALPRYADEIITKAREYYRAS